MATTTRQGGAGSGRANGRSPSNLSAGGPRVKRFLQPRARRCVFTYCCAELITRNIYRPLQKSGCKPRVLGCRAAGALFLPVVVVVFYIGV